MASRAVWSVVPLLVVLLAGCSPGRFIARHTARAPNSYPTFFAPAAPITLSLGTGMLQRLPEHSVPVGPPAATLHVRVIEPGNYGLQITTTNWHDDRRHRLKLKMQVMVPATDAPPPRGTVFLLHGYGIAKDAMAPWGFLLAEAGWRCVLVDLRGHGRSSGDHIFFGTVEAADLSQLLDALERRGVVTGPFGVLGVSYGASLALRWAGLDPRVRATVAVTPYAELAPAMVAIRDQYARWIPRAWARSGARELPGVLGVTADELDTSAFLEARPVAALFVAAELDRITPVADVARLVTLAAPDSEAALVPGAGHEPAPYFFEELHGPVREWFDRELR